MSPVATCETETISVRAREHFRIFEHVNHFYAIPTRLVRFNPEEVENVLQHPAVLHALSREILSSLIAAYDPAPFECERVGVAGDYDLIRHRGRIYGVPRALGPLDLNLEENRDREGVVSAESSEEVLERIAAYRQAVPVEFLGWMPAFLSFGNCGKHPQFGHTKEPPPGYRFTRSAPKVSRPRPPRPRRKLFAALARPIVAVWISACMFLSNCWKFGTWRCLVTLVMFVQLVIRLARKTGRVLPALRFAHTRNFTSQVMAPRTDLAFVTSVPFTYGQNPWVIEIEDATTLFFPFISNGRTRELNVQATPYFGMVKALLEADSCRGILTHMRSTAEAMPALFGSEIINRKVSYAPLGVQVPKHFQTHEESETINLLFTNSWHQTPVGFYLRGGLDVLEAFSILHDRYPQLRLTIRTNVPPLDERYHRIIEKGWVRIIRRFTSLETLDEIQRESHIYVLPAARIHIVSVLQAMSYGQAVVVSDGWGMDEYITPEVNGLIVKGRGRKVSWMDRTAGVLREDYGPMYKPNAMVVDGLVESISRLVEDRDLRRRLGLAARQDVETKYSLTQWNLALKATFDKARAAG